jgi:NTP pyrophosphatase (non-canonical NTP hydrolase)
VELNDYQLLAHKTSAITSSSVTGSPQHAMMATLGLCGESGEVADLLKKVYFHGHTLDKQQLIHELGDVLWYLAEQCTAFHITLDEVAAANIAKLQQRYGDSFSSEASRNRKD